MIPLLFPPTPSAWLVVSSTPSGWLLVSSSMGRAIPCLRTDASRALRSLRATLSASSLAAKEASSSPILGILGGCERVCVRGGVRGDMRVGSMLQKREQQERQQWGESPQIQLHHTYAPPARPSSTSSAPIAVQGALRGQPPLLPPSWHLAVGAEEVGNEEEE